MREFWLEAYQKARNLLTDVERMDRMAGQRSMAEVRVQMDRLRMPYRFFREHVFSKDLAVGSSDFFTAIMGLTCFAVALDGPEIFDRVRTNGEEDPFEFIRLWCASLRRVTEMFHEQCQEAAATCS